MASHVAIVFFTHSPTPVSPMLPKPFPPHSTPLHPIPPLSGFIVWVITLQTFRYIDQELVILPVKQCHYSSYTYCMVNFCLCNCLLDFNTVSICVVPPNPWSQKPHNTSSMLLMAGCGLGASNPLLMLHYWGVLLTALFFFVWQCHYSIDIEKIIIEVRLKPQGNGWFIYI